jgi:tetratricopeptide (TPR) repeat protein
VAHLKSLAGVDKDPAAGADGGYLGRMRPVMLQTIQLDLDTRRFRSAVAAAQRMTTASADDALALYWLGESYRALGPRPAQWADPERSVYDQRVAYQQAARRTEQEEADRLAATPEGKAVLASNRQKAEELFRKSAGADPALPEPYFGLGSLYEQEGRKGQAVEAYRKYMELSRQPLDQERAGRRVEELTKSAPGGVQ